MPNNKAADLTNHLMATIERLSDESLSSEDLAREVTRSQAIVHVGRTAIDNNRLILDAYKAAAELEDAKAELPAILAAGPPRHKTLPPPRRR